MGSRGEDDGDDDGGDDGAPPFADELAALLSLLLKASFPIKVSSYHGTSVQPGAECSGGRWTTNGLPFRALCPACCVDMCLPPPPRRKVVLGVPPDLVLGRALAVREGPVGRVRVVAVAAAAILGEFAPPLDPPVRAGLFLILAGLLLPREGPDVERTKGTDRVAASLTVVGAFVASSSC